MAAIHIAHALVILQASLLGSILVTNVIQSLRQGALGVLILQLIVLGSMVMFQFTVWRILTRIFFGPPTGGSNASPILNRDLDTAPWEHEQQN